VGITALTWLTGTAWSGLRPYSDRAGGDDSDWEADEAAGDTSQDAEGAGQGAPRGRESDEWSTPAESGKLQAAFSIFPRDTGVPPESLARRFYDVVQWSTHDRGGHFAATERPEAVARDLLQAARVFGGGEGRTART